MKILIKRIRKTKKEDQITRLLDILENLNAEIYQCDNCDIYGIHDGDFVECVKECGNFLCKNCINHTKNHMESTKIIKKENIEIYCSEYCRGDDD